MVDKDEKKVEISEEGLHAAQMYCQWYLGDGLWANDILRAARNPEETLKRLQSEGMEL